MQPEARFFLFVSPIRESVLNIFHTFDLEFISLFLKKKALLRIYLCCHKKRVFSSVSLTFFCQPTLQLNSLFLVQSIHLVQQSEKNNTPQESTRTRSTIKNNNSTSYLSPFDGINPSLHGNE
jgi:hypothetical protein